MATGKMRTIVAASAAKWKIKLPSIGHFVRKNERQSRKQTRTKKEKKAKKGVPEGMFIESPVSAV